MAEYRREELMAFFAVYETTDHWDSSNECSSTQCPNHPWELLCLCPMVGALESLLKPSHTMLWVLFSATWPSKLNCLAFPNSL